MIPASVGGAHGGRERLDEFGGLRPVIGPLASRWARFPPSANSSEKNGRLAAADRVDRDNVRMAQPRDELGLGQEPPEWAGGCEVISADRLDRHDPAEPQLGAL